MLSVVRINKIKELLAIIKIKSDDVEIFDEALTHPSFNFEKNIENAPNYERLEFLGDSVLRLVVSDFLYEKYPDFDEGKLTKIRSYLVSDEFLAKIAKGINLQNYLNIGAHEEKDGGRKKESIIACAMEAVFGAVYKSLGYEIAKELIFGIYQNVNENLIEVLYVYNSKDILQQYTQGKNKDLPIYKITNESGLAHSKSYEVSVIYEDEILGIGQGKTKKEAEKMAAYCALKKLKLIEGCENE